MYAVIDLDNIDVQNIYFGEKQKNNIIQKCYFSNIYYSNIYYTLNNIVFEINLDLNYLVNNINNNNIFFDTKLKTNRSTIDKLKQFEKQILKYYNQSFDLNIEKSLYHQLKKGYIRISFQNKPSNVKLLLRISGVWENHEHQIGLIYKFIKPNISKTIDYSKQMFHVY